MSSRNLAPLCLLALALNPLAATNVVAASADAGAWVGKAVSVSSSPELDHAANFNLKCGGESGLGSWHYMNLGVTCASVFELESSSGTEHVYVETSTTEPCVKGKLVINFDNRCSRAANATSAWFQWLYPNGVVDNEGCVYLKRPADCPL